MCIFSIWILILLTTTHLAYRPVSRQIGKHQVGEDQTPKPKNGVSNQWKNNFSSTSFKIFSGLGCVADAVSFSFLNDPVVSETLSAIAYLSRAYTGTRMEVTRIQDVFNSNSCLLVNVAFGSRCQNMLNVTQVGRLWKRIAYILAI